MRRAPFAGGVVDCPPLGSRVAAPFTQKVPLPTERDHPCLIVDWNVEAGLDAELRGKGGVICGAGENVDPSSYGVWIRDLKKVFMVDGQDITSTGQREPPQPIPRTAKSTCVGEDGEVRGQDEYVVLDEIDAHW